MQFNVSDNSIETVSTERLVAGSVRIFTAEFRFDGSWDGYAKTAVFRAVARGGAEVRREMVITDGRCQVPHECLIENAYLCVGVYGINGDKVRPTVWTRDFSLFVHPGAEPAQPGRENVRTVRFNQTVEKTGIVVPSANYKSSKKFFLCVDDTGTISATEVTS